jgi:segregation and condensation protein B
MAAFHRFESMFDPTEGKLGVLVTFLWRSWNWPRSSLLDVVQEAPLAPIYVKSLATEQRPRRNAGVLQRVRRWRRRQRHPRLTRQATPDPPEPPAPMDQALINRIVEAALLAASQPLTLVQLQWPVPAGRTARSARRRRAGACRHCSAACADRGVELVEVASGFRYQVKADVHPWVARLWTERKTKYTRATLETLALIAYRQPITRGEIEQVRGVAVNSNIIKALEEREWIRVVGHRDVPGRPELFGTTKGFLDYFGLKRLDELPPLSELKDIGELEPQLEFDDAPRRWAHCCVTRWRHRIGAGRRPAPLAISGTAMPPSTPRTADADDRHRRRTSLERRRRSTRLAGRRPGRR